MQHEPVAYDIAGGSGDQCCRGLWFGIEAALEDHLALGLAFLIVSLVRAYVLRRLFDRIAVGGLSLRANKSETFDSLKFTLEGSGERSNGNARTSAHALACRA